MPNTKITFVDIVTTNYVSSDIKTKCISESRKRILQHHEDRAFDEFSYLIDTQKQNELTTCFLRILENFPKMDEKFWQFTLKAFQKHIAEIGCTSLFESNGKVKPELICLLKWEDLQDNINTLNLLCGFIGAVNQQILSQPEIIQAVQNDRESFAMLSSYCNREYRNWAMSKLKALNIPYTDLNQSAPLREILAYTRNNPGTTKSVLGAAAVLIGIGLGFFASSYQKDEESQPRPVRQMKPL